MTEYDFSPEAYGRYMETHDRISQWAGSASHYPPPESYGVSPSGDRRFMTDETRHSGRHRRGHDSEDRGRSRHRMQPSSSHGVRTPNPFEFAGEYPMPGPPGFERNPSHGSFIPTMNGSSHPLETRQNSRGYTPSFGATPSLQPNQPLDERYPPHQHSHPAPTPQLSLVHVPSQASLPYTSSHHSIPHSVHQYPASHTPIHMSPSGYGSRYSSRHRSPDRSDDSYSSRSYSSDSRSRSPSRNSYMYRDQHGNHGPTVVQPSAAGPMIVPINGGLGGFLVVPAVGQTLHVMVGLQILLRCTSLTHITIGPQIT